MNYNGGSRLAPPYLSDLLHIATYISILHSPTVPSALLLGGAHCHFRSGLLTLALCSNPDHKLIRRDCYTVLGIVLEGFGKKAPITEMRNTFNNSWFYLFLPWTLCGSHVNAICTISVPVSRCRGVSTAHSAVTKASVNLTSFSKNSRGYTQINLTQGFV